MIDIVNGLRRIAEEGYRFADDAADEIERLRASLEAAEKDVTLKERVIDALGSELNAVVNERDALHAKITEMERQEPARLVTPTAYRWRYRGAVKWQYGELTEETVQVAKEHNHEIQSLYAIPGAQPAPSVPSGLHPLETVRFWADAYTHPGDDNFRGHGMAAALLREYAELRAALSAAQEAKP